MLDWRQRGNGNSRTHRVFVLCPDCRCQIPAGRLAQHYRKHGNLNEAFNVVG